MKKQTKSLIMPVFVLCLSLACICYGCLGLSNKGDIDSDSVIVNPKSDLSISGRAFFNERRIYGNIPITVKNFQKEVVAVTTTDSAGYYAFASLPAGLYHLSASTGESEVTFGNLIQVTDQGCVQVPPTSLLCVKSVVVDRISSSSIHLDFFTNRASRATIEYGAVGGYPKTKTLGQAGKTHHETTLEGLSALTNYEIVLKITGDDGQEFIMNGLSAATTGIVGCQNLAVNINMGDYDTNDHRVYLSLSADDCAEVKISENYNLENSSWQPYKENFNYTFANASPGIKRVYVKFKSKSGVESPTLSDSIVYTTSGYIGIWINNGAYVTNSNKVELTAIFPGATQMILSESPSFSNAFWEPYLSKKQWTFSNEDGNKTIYCRFKGGKANPEEIFEATITIDNTPPKVELVINNGQTVTASQTVDIHFIHSGQPPALMQISNDKEPATNQQWITFKDYPKWKLSDGDGDKTIYAIFRDSVGNQYGPVGAQITLDTVAPAGNEISIQLTDAEDSEVASFSLIENLPVYLHFKATDESTYRAYYYVGPATTTVPTKSEFLDILSPFSPVELDANHFGLGDNKIWAYFTDKAGNESFIKNTFIRIEGPELIVKPASIKLYSGQTASFSYDLKNISDENVGNVNWIIASGATGVTAIDGVIQDNFYTAPSPLCVEKTIYIQGTSALTPSLSGLAKIELKTSPEIGYRQETGLYTKTPVEKQIMPGQSAEYSIYLYHNKNGIKIETNPEVGTAIVSPPVSAEYGCITTLTYTAPDSIPDLTTVPIKFCAVDDANLMGSLSCVISTGANISLKPNSNIAQKSSPVKITATVLNTELQEVEWKLYPPTIGSFASDSQKIEAKTTAPNHEIVFYPSSPSKISPASITASIGGASKELKLQVYPPLDVRIEPIATYAMPIAEPIILKVNPFEYAKEGTDESIKWEFKNENSPDFMPADGKTYMDRGTLKVLSDNNQVEYLRPTKRPSDADSSASDVILVRATSKADPTASATSRITLAEKVKVTIFDDVSKTNVTNEAATVIEVGKLQFYAKVTPDIIGNQTVSWTVNGSSGDSDSGTIDSRGLYVAPNEIINTHVKIRATSNYDASAYAEVDVTLNDFWVSKNQNLVDSVNAKPMPISTIFVDPNTGVGEPFIVYAGAGAENRYGGYYGLWVAAFSDEPGNTSGGNWKGIPGFHATTAVTADSGTIYDQYLIHNIALTRGGKMYCTTGDGVYYVKHEKFTNEHFSDDSPLDPSMNSATKLVPAAGCVFNNMPENTLPNTPLIGLETATINGIVYLYLSSDVGVYEYKMKNDFQIASVRHMINTQSSTKEWETREFEETIPETPTASATTITVEVSAWSFTDTQNPIKSFARPIRYDNQNKKLYVACDNFSVYNCAGLGNNLEFLKKVPTFLNSKGKATGLQDIYNIPSTAVGYPAGGSIGAQPRALALDIINTNTLWAATNNGVYRSTDSGTNWSSVPFGEASGNVNCRAIFLDPNNPINVMAGGEDGLYRSTNAGSSWTRIRSGLGNHKTITSLTQGYGAASKRRKVWVGTAGGVFMGKEALALE